VSDQFISENASEKDQILCLCGNSEAFAKKFTSLSYRFVSCKTCESLFRIPPYFEIEAYPDDYYGESETEKFWLSPIISLLEYERKGRARFLSKFCNSESSALDIGCGNGKLLKKISELKPNCKISGIELDSKAARRASKIDGIRVFNNGFHEADLGSEKFSAISMIHSFEHIPDPEKTIQKLTKHTTNGGVVYIAIPNRSSFQYKLFRKHWLHLDPEWHLHFIRPSVLKSRMKKEGFEFIKAKHFHPVQNIPGFILSTHNIFTKKRDVLFNLLKDKKKLKKVGGLLSFIFLGLFSAILFVPAIIEEIMATLFRRGATIDMIFRKKV
jgi:SAM-dependent methyltransferase